VFRMPVPHGVLKSLVQLIHDRVVLLGLRGLAQMGRIARDGRGLGSRSLAKHLICRRTTAHLHFTSGVTTLAKSLKSLFSARW
jgi:hypothetical protein